MADKNVCPTCQLRPSSPIEARCLAKTKTPDATERLHVNRRNALQNVADRHRLFEALQCVGPRGNELLTDVTAEAGGGDRPHDLCVVELLRLVDFVSPRHSARVVMGEIIVVVADVGQHVLLHHRGVIDIVEDLHTRRARLPDRRDAPLGRIAHVVPVVDRVEQFEAHRHLLPLGVAGDLLQADHTVFEPFLVVHARAVARKGDDVRESGCGGGVDALADRCQAFGVIFQPVQALGNAVADRHGADQAVFLQRWPLVGRGQLDRLEPHFRAGGGKLVQRHLSPPQIVVIAPEAYRLLDSLLRLGSQASSGKRPDGADGRRPRHAPQHRPPRAAGLVQLKTAVVTSHGDLLVVSGVSTALSIPGKPVASRFTVSLLFRSLEIGDGCPFFRL